ncbi:MAG: hypothetical protein FWE13_04330 [Firmicutes bacterium]|nr:hypothetical protein [Bacillota bacterium]
MKRNEIIAKKNNFMLWLSITFFVIFLTIVLFIIIPIIPYINSPWTGLYIVALMTSSFIFLIVFLIITSIVSLIIWLCIPKTLITLYDGKLILYPEKQEIKIENILKVSVIGWSKLNIYLANTKIKVRFIKNSREVATHIEELILQISKFN